LECAIDPEDLLPKQDSTARALSIGFLPVTVLPYLEVLPIRLRQAALFHEEVCFLETSLFLAFHALLMEDIQLSI
jgi:hypothetical protein